MSEIVWTYKKLDTNILLSSHLDKIKREGPHSISRPMAPLPPPRESSKRDARKKSLDLPGKYWLHQIFPRILYNKIIKMTFSLKKFVHWFLKQCSVCTIFSWFKTRYFIRCQLWRFRKITLFSMNWRSCRHCFKNEWTLVAEFVTL